MTVGVLEPANRVRQGYDSRRLLEYAYGAGGDGGYSCGDGMMSAGEECDDANLDDGDGCSSACKVECGFMCDSAIEPSECWTSHEGPACGNMCVMARDFNPHVDLGAMQLGPPGSTCESTDSEFKMVMNVSSWDDVTCELVESTIANPLRDGVGVACCGSLAQTRCMEDHMGQGSGDASGSGSFMGDRSFGSGAGRHDVTHKANRQPERAR